jgi:erythrocyte band 7 integral membrane protein
MFFVIPCMDEIVTMDLRTVTFNVPPQEILTKDSVTVAVDAVVYFKIVTPLYTVLNVNNYNQSTQYLACTTLRNILGTKTLAELLSHREEIAHDMKKNLDGATDPWGIKARFILLWYYNGKLQL